MSDNKFFTNEPGSSLLDRFIAILKDVQFFDVIVGYFRASGFYLMRDSMKDIDKIRILVGLNTDTKTYEILEEANQFSNDFESHSKTKEILREKIIGEFSLSEDKFEVEQGVKTFLEMLITDCENKEKDIENGGNGKILEIKAYPSSDLHAKVYVGRFPVGNRDYGRVITGSSNFSHNGLKSNLEFNVELKDRVDVDFALEQFERLWLDAVDVSDEYVATLNHDTWIKDDITPYELYLKMLFEYFKEDINIDQEIKLNLPPGFMRLDYQQQAVLNAKKILEGYHGVFLADVVGLGKTFISALLAQQLQGGKLIICPPVLKKYWEDTLRDFNVVNFEVESLGKLERLKDRSDRYKYVFIDEAHRFRNEYTQGFEDLDLICKGKKVVLVSATPINNRFDDLLAQLRLFQPLRRSTIPGVSNLEKFFQSVNKPLRNHEKGSPEYLDELKNGAKQIRDKVLSHIMVRRTRTEIQKYFDEDMKNKKLFFPEMAKPQKIIYEFNDKIEEAFSLTIQKLAAFKYSRYTPKSYLISQDSEEGREKALGGFMKGLLVKRLESSFYAFSRSVERFIDSYIAFIDMYNNGKVLVSKKINVYDLMDEDDESKIEQLINDNKVERYKVELFRDEYYNDLTSDLRKLEEIKALWDGVISFDKDEPKVNSFISSLKNDDNLKGKKVIVFTESKETGDYLQHHLGKEFGKQVLLFSSKGGVMNETILSNRDARDKIEANYDPNHIGQESDDIQFLITTDILAEGINLHRSNIVINYDLPWNPTRVLQRVGRVNRVGTKHKKIFVYNFFPTEASKRHLNLEDIIISKIQAFHNTLGEDAAYLSIDEEVVSHELFGSNLYKKLSDKSTYESNEEDGGFSELEYLKEIRNIRDKDTDLYKKIKNLPKKAKSSKLSESKGNELVTFFRKGKLKKFYKSNKTDCNELSFYDAVEILKCDKKTRQSKIDKQYFDFLHINKKTFFESTSEEELLIKMPKANTNEGKIIRRLKSPEIMKCDKFTDNDDNYLSIILEAFKYGVINKNISKRIAKEIETEINPIKVLFILKQNITEDQLSMIYRSETSSVDKREVILSEYLTHG